MSVQIDVSFGELIDKITILQIKFERIDDADKLKNIEYELATLQDCWQRCGVDTGSVDEEHQQLKRINETLWDLEDKIRLKESAKTFDDDFVQLARQVYLTNDERSRVKRIINDRLGSAMVEEKSYQPY